MVSLIRSSLPHSLTHSPLLQYMVCTTLLCCAVLCCALSRAMDSGAMDTKGGMVFITLTDMQLDGAPWDVKFQDLMCGRWTAVSVTAMLCCAV